MRAFLLRRLFSFLVTLGVASFFIFALLRQLPGDPAQNLLKHPTPEKLAEVRAQLGLDRPLPVQYILWLKHVLRGSFGKSFRTDREVADDLARHWPATLELALAAMLIALSVGVPLGTWAAAHRGTWKDIGATAVSLIGLSTPIFWLGLLAILIFALWLQWLPAGDRLDGTIPLVRVTGFVHLDALRERNWAAFVSATQHLLLPALVLAAVPAAFLARITRAAVSDALDQEFIRTARAKGLAPRAVLWRHALRAAAGPIATMGNVQLSYLIGGAVLTETVFSWPGLGRYLTGAILDRDYPAVQGALLLVVAAVVVLNLLGDIFQARLEPWLREVS